MIKIIHNEQIRKLVYVRRGMAAGHKDKEMNKSCKKG